MGTDSWVQCNDAPVKVCRYPVTGLREGCSYTFRVRAVNSAGVSRPSRSSDAVAALDPVDLGRLQGRSPRLRVPSTPGGRGATLKNVVTGGASSLRPPQPGRTQLTPAPPCALCRKAAKWVQNQPFLSLQVV